MMSHLHSRKRPSHAHAGHAGSLGHRISQEGSKDRKNRPSEVRNALVVVGSFLILGFALGYLILHNQHRKVVLHVMNNAWMGHHGKNQARSGGPPRFTTVVMSSVVLPEGRGLRLQSIADTWGPHARAVFVVHNQTEFPSAPLMGEESQGGVYPRNLLVPVELDLGVPRVTYVIRTVHKEIDPDFAFFVNDHTFVIPEHLCLYLSEKDPKNDMYVGHALKNDKSSFNSGAAGYLLSRKTMAKLVKAWDTNDSNCMATSADKWLQGNPGLVTAKCLETSLHIPVEDTRKDGRYHRFHAFGLVRTVSGKVDEWYHNKHRDLDKIAGFDASYSTLLSGKDCCSEDTISFHYVEHLETRALYKIRQALSENAGIRNDDLKAMVLREWPRDVKDLGGYSRGLPDKDSEDEWATLLAVIRRISPSSTQTEWC